MNPWIKLKPEQYHLFFASEITSIQGDPWFDELFLGASTITANVYFGGDYGIKYPRYANFQIYTPPGCEWEYVKRVLNVMPEESAMGLKTAAVGTNFDRLRFTMGKAGAYIIHANSHKTEEVGPLTIEISPVCARYRGTTSAKDIVGIGCVFDQMKII